MDRNERIRKKINIKQSDFKKMLDDVNYTVTDEAYTLAWSKKHEAL